ncbi:TetR family transcriptional regulator C-terminal domain-containing protein [Nocardiopsis sp. N85]|uniref:TetR family transcriptional regulator C-terminal domain-containing protein n=1 Tax=Nocardiopsis sp. N85 TaxID=3029400 RepID=UPI00237EF957|nr:TetR family transcriptional regulator C-terminal domain-containing protein [Nocardiopsis sp. N85]MDE3720824.1 TetR family transcriptional regulator C-terminal domain-containing protein [Nocardiopsis sp. N85]
MRNTSPGGRRVTRGDRDRRRDGIPRIAMEVSAARGHDKASLAEISDRVGLTRVGALHHLPCEADPLTGVPDLRDATAEHGADRPRGRAFPRHLVRTIRADTECQGTVRLHTAPSSESVTDDHPAREYVQGRYGGLRRMVADASAESRDDGEIAADLDTGRTAASIIAVMDGLRVQGPPRPDAVDGAATASHAIGRLTGADPSGHEKVEER